MVGESKALLFNFSKINLKKIKKGLKFCVIKFCKL